MGTSFSTEADIRSRRKKINFGVNDLSYLLNQTNSRVCLWDYSGEVVIDAILNGDIVFSGNNDFSSASTSLSPDSILGQVSKGYNLLRTGAATLSLVGIGNGLAERKFRSPLQTVVDWNGSGEFTLALQVVFVCLDPTYDVRDDISLIMRGVYPSIGDANLTIKAPMGYVKLSNKTLSLKDVKNFNFDTYKTGGVPGCWGIAIGDWFEAEPTFVMTNAAITASKEQNYYGNPLYASGTIAVKCSQMTSWQMIGRWLKREGINPDDTGLLG